MRTLVLGLLLTVLTSSVFANFRVVGYLPTYRFGSSGSIDWNTLTHLMPSFANPDASLNWSISSSITSLVSTAQSKNVKVFISIGGGGLDNTMINRYKANMPAGTRTSLITKLMNYVRTNNLDGVDVDLEGSLVQDANYNGFVIELGDSLHAANKEMSCALAQWNSGGISSQAYAAFDFINLMAYDYTGPWQPNNPGQHAPMSQFTNYFTHWTVTKSVPKDKVVMGLPFYGYEFKNGSASAWTWCDITTNYPNDLDNDQVTTSQGTLYYNGRKTIADKVKHAKNNQGGGVMIWELGQDCFSNDDKSLMKIIKDNIVSTPEIEQKQLKIYPNPANNVIRMENTFSGLLQILDLSGKIVLSENISKNAQLNIAHLAKGNYLLKLISDRQIMSQVLIKK